MSSPNIIIKSGYITSHEHVVNTLDYAGNKIASQKIMFKDGSSAKVDADKKITLPLDGQSDVSGIHIEYKDGGCKKLSYAAYKKITKEAKETVTVDKLTGIEDDEALLANDSGKRYHRMEDLDFFKYLPYIEGRPGAEKSDGHGLFGLTGDISLEEAKQTALEYKDSRKWSHIISLDSDGAKRTGYDNREAWKNLIISKAPKIAEQYNINDLNNLIINCAYHSNTDNPHVHLIFYSKDKTDGFIKGGIDGMNEASESLKSMFNNIIFKDDVADLTGEKSLVWKEMQKPMREFVANVRSKEYSYTEMNLKLHELADHMQASGEENRSYGFLSADLKSEVSDILRHIISNDDDMQGLFEKYLDSQRKIISQYVVDETVLAAKMLDFENRFFIPDKKVKDSTWHHNRIVEAAKQIISQKENILSFSPQADNAEEFLAAADAPYERATKKGKNDFAISQEPVSTETYSSSKEYNEPQFNSHIVNEALIPSDADASPEHSRELIAIPEYIPEESIVRERATKRKNSDSTAQESGLSSKTVHEVLKDTPDCLNGKSFSRIYRHALNGIYNPKLENSELQGYLAAELEALGSIEKESRNKYPAKLHAKNIFNALYNKNPDFKESIENLFENSHQKLTEVYGAEFSQNYLDKFKSNMLSPAATNAMHNYIFYFADTLQDQKYYQLLGAYSEFNKPLNKALYLGLSNMYDEQDSRPQFLDHIRELKKLAEYLDDKNTNAKACNIVRGMFSSLISDADVSAIFGRYEKDYLEVIKEHIDDSEKYCRCFSDNLHSVNQLMRPHYSVIRFSQNCEQFVLGKISRDKEIHKDLNSKLYSYMCEALTDRDSFSSELIRQELERFEVSQKSSHLSNIFRYIHSTDEIFRKKADKTIEAVYTRLKQELGTDSALMLIGQYKENLFECNEESSHSWMMKHFIENLSENYYRQITMKHKEIFQLLNKALFESLQNNLTNRELIPKLSELQTLVNRDSPEESDVKAALDKRISSLSKVIFNSLKNEEITTLIDRCSEEMNPLFSLYCDDPNMRLTLEERLCSDLYHGEFGTIQFIVQNYAKDLAMHQAKHIIKEMKKEISEFKSKLFGQLRKAFIRGNNQALNCLSQMKTDPNKIQAFSFLLQTISDDKIDFNMETEKLYQCFAERMAAKSFNYSPEQTRKIFDSFFYGQNESEYDTMYLRETALNAYEQKDKIVAGFAINTLLQGLSCMIREQSEAAMQSTRDRNRNHLHKKPLQFRRLKPDHEQQLYVNISY